MPDAALLDPFIAQLESELARLAGEARTYPGPIARCDDQLPALLERRTRVADALRAARDLRDAIRALDAS